MEIRQITGQFGARITGIDLAVPLQEGTLQGIWQALKQHKVLVFPGQQALTPGKHLAFAKHFGAPELQHPSHPDYPGSPGLKVLKSTGEAKTRDTWHTDGSTRVDTAWISFLKAVDIPPHGRDTLFADMEAVYSRLSAPMQAFLEGLTAQHSWGPQKPDIPPVEHPVVMKDAATGQKWLYVNKIYTNKILGLTERESDTLLQFLFDRAHEPECQLRVSWEPGTLTMWDNEVTQHYLVQDVVYPRIMHRVMVSYP